MKSSFFRRRMLAVGVLGLSTQAQAVILVAPVPGGPLHAYHRDATPREWDDARLAAQATTYRGFTGHLATITSANEQRWAHQIAGDIDDTWIGLTDNDALGGVEFGNMEDFPRPQAGQPAGPNERGAGWVWVTGEPVAFNNWSTFEPNDAGGGEDGAHLRSDGFWNDDRAGTALGQGGAFHPSLIEYDIHADAATVDAFKVTLVKHFNGITNLAIADDVVAGVYPSTITTGNLAAPVLDMRDSGSGANAPIDLPVPGLVQDAGNDHFVSVSQATLNVLSAGVYTFAFNSDDGGRLKIDGVTVAEFFGERGPGNTFSAPMQLAAGQHTLEFLWFESVGGAQAEVGYAPGAQPFLSTAFTLIGDPSFGIAVVGNIQSTTYDNNEETFFGLEHGQGLTGLQAAELLLTGAIPGTRFEFFADRINMNDEGTTLFFGDDDFYPGLVATRNRERYIMEATGLLEIVEPGFYTIGTRSDDDARVFIDGALVLDDDSMPGRNAFATVFLDAGLHPIRLLTSDDGGEAEIELFAALGTFTAFDAQAFRLIGDTAGGGLRVTQSTGVSTVAVPEPTLALWPTLAWLLAGRRRQSGRR